MHKTDLIEVIAKEANLTKVNAAACLETALKTITKALKKKEVVTLIGFGTFKVVRTSARKGRNPQTGKEIQIKASNRVKFSVGKALKESVN